MKVYKKPLTALIVINDEDELMETINTSFGGEGTGHDPDTKRQDLDSSPMWGYDSGSDL